MGWYYIYVIYIVFIYGHGAHKRPSCPQSDKRMDKVGSTSNKNTYTDLRILTMVVPDFRPIYIRYPAEYTVSFAGYPAGRITRYPATKTV